MEEEQKPPVVVVAAEQKQTSRGPIRLRIDSLTIKLEPFESALTNEEAIHVRNAIESLLQNYFFEVQPWVVPAVENDGNSNDLDASYNNINNNENQQQLPPSLNATADGSVTYVGLAQILENKQTDSGQVELTMNGLVYFAEGSRNIPDETELLQTMEEQALGDPVALTEALRGYFPALEQQLVVTIEPTAHSGGTTGNDSDSSTSTIATTIEPRPSHLRTKVPKIPTLETADAFPTTTPPLPWEDPIHGSNQVVAVIAIEQAGNNDRLGGNNDDGSSFNVAALAGGMGVAMAGLAVAIGLFAMQRRQNSPSYKRSNGKSRKKPRSSGNEYLVPTSDAENGLKLSKDDWKANSNNNNNKDLRLSSLALSATAEESIASEPGTMSSPVAKIKTPRSASNNNNAVPPYVSSFFKKKQHPAINYQQQHLVSSESSNEDKDENENNNINKDGTGGGETVNNNINNINDVCQLEFTDDGLSDFESVISIQPHMVAIESLESFEEQHTNMTRMDCVVQKDQLRSPFIGDQLQQQQQQQQQQQHVYEKDDQEDQRIRYSMMPNPYFHRRGYPGATGATTIQAEDRSAPCVLTETDVTAATLARRNSSNSKGVGTKARTLPTTTTSPTSGTGLGMVPKLKAPSWWSPSSGGNHRSNTSLAAAAAANGAEDYNHAYPGDEENTFGVPESDGWDPADTELSSIGDNDVDNHNLLGTTMTPQDELDMLVLHPRAIATKKPNKGTATTAATRSVSTTKGNNHDDDTNHRHSAETGSPEKNKIVCDPPGAVLPTSSNDIDNATLCSSKDSDGSSLDDLKFDHAANMEP